jgi:hypothetical protein
MIFDAVENVPISFSSENPKTASVPDIRQTVQ